MGEVAARAFLQIVPVLFVIVVVAVAFIRHQSARKQQAQGVLWLQAMRMLLTHIQRHRGLSSGVLSGDKSLQGMLEEVQLQVSRDFEQIGSVGEWIKVHRGWQSITQHWARLAGNVYRLPVGKSIDQHNRLISNILVFVDEIAAQHYLSGSSSFKSNIWRDLLTLAEFVGQIRAVGTVIAARNNDWDDKATADARQKLQDLTQALLAALELPRCRMGLDPETLQGVLDFLSYIDAKLLRLGSDVSAAEYYARATKALDILLERFDEELSQVNRRLVRTP